MGLPNPASASRPSLAGVSGRYSLSPVMVLLMRLSRPRSPMVEFSAASSTIGSTVLPAPGVVTGPCLGEVTVVRRILSGTSLSGPLSEDLRASWSALCTTASASGGDRSAAGEEGGGGGR